MKQIRIGTRGSRLALWQAEAVKSALKQAGIESEIVVIKTLGDEWLDISIQKIGEKGVFTKALDDALLQDEIDLAVHSTKDIPTQFSEDLDIIAVMKREDPRDVLLALSDEVHLENYTRSFRIGTSSLRRQALMRHFFPGHSLLELRGNLDLRLEKLKSGAYDGIVLAYAGVIRNNMQAYITQKFNVTVFTPAVAQGAVGIMGRKNSPVVNTCRPLLNDITSEIEVITERAFLNRMNGGCHAPIFGLATLTADTLHLSAGVAAIDGSRIIRQEVTGTADNALHLGISLAETVLSLGGKELLHGTES